MRLHNDIGQSVCVHCVSYITAPVGVSFPFFLLLLLASCGQDLGMGLHPGIESQDVLHHSRTKRIWQQLLLLNTAGWTGTCDCWYADDGNISTFTLFSFSKSYIFLNQSDHLEYRNIFYFKKYFVKTTDASWPPYDEILQMIYEYGHVSV